MKRDNQSAALRLTNLPGISTGMDTQKTTILIAVMVGGSIVHPVMPAASKENNVTIRSNKEACVL